MSEIERLYTLKEAVEAFLPGFTVSSLRTAIRHGHLVPLKFAGKFCVTEAAIREMLDKCRAEQKAQTLAPASARRSRGNLGHRPPPKGAKHRLRRERH